MSCCSTKDDILKAMQVKQDMLINFNHLLLDRIRHLEETIKGMVEIQAKLNNLTNNNDYIVQQQELKIPQTFTGKKLTKRSSSTSDFFLQTKLLSPSPIYSYNKSIRSCPSSVDGNASKSDNKFNRSALSTDNLNMIKDSKLLKKLTKKLNIKSSSSKKIESEQILSVCNCVSLPVSISSTPATISTVKKLGSASLYSSTNEINSPTSQRLETRRFARDVDDNEVRAFKAMVYMEQARKEHGKEFKNSPLCILRKAFRPKKKESITTNTYDFLKKLDD
ncbi:unnamed protein product [Didymodactylos carnosus]|uniref:Uncharacterized protein n=1 Tax=Didymodactylos carnosus TaxID=1234261 RepID=A0A813NA84_9BILA|nr:unnamed protein product [Didymodactylos carnosus]CAF1033012.1 unnamed protein product [Didymodactylos carnosus]CAF3514626.1 unnamed protein product [Didymodactylos carnosus]CAF3801273.1 unnamed protein product [Didymodactylos carnosus]